jgi:hypothetical protein
MAGINGMLTRRYHGLLIAALPAPSGRTVMLNYLSEQIRLPNGNSMLIGSEKTTEEELKLSGAASLTEFRLDTGLPVWRYEGAGIVLEKHLLLPHRQNTVHVTYRLLSGDGILRLKLRPLLP